MATAINSYDVAASTEDSEDDSRIFREYDLTKTIDEVNEFMRTLPRNRFTAAYELPLLGNSPNDRAIRLSLSRSLNMVIMNRGQYWPSIPTTVRYARDKILRIEEFAPEGYNDPEYSRGRKLEINHGESLGSRYVIESFLGCGTYGDVFCARDRASLKLVAVKANQSSDVNRIVALRELRALNMIALNDPHNENRCLRVIDSFKFRGHICFTTPLHGMSMLDFMECQMCEDRGDLMPLPLSHIRSITRQLLGAVAFLHRMHIIHGDIKLDNIVICDSSYTTFPYDQDIPSISSCVTRRGPSTRSVLNTPDIRLIDFGCVVFPDEDHDAGLSTAQVYYPPEAIVGDTWSYPVDIWSVGCLLIEMLVGEAAFYAENELQRMAVMQKMLGPIPTEMAQRWQHAVMEDDGRGNEGICFFRNGMLNFPYERATPDVCSHVFYTQPLHAYGCSPTYFASQYADLVRQLLNFDQRKRLTALEALKHPWFEAIADPDDGTRAADRLWQGRTLQQIRDARLRVDRVYSL